MRLLFGIKSMARSGGGAERVLAQVASGLERRGHQIGIVTWDQPDAKSFYPIAEGIEWIRIPIGPTADRSGFVDTVQRTRRLRNLASAWKPDGAIGFMHSMFVPLAAALTGLRIPLVCSEHIIPDHYRERKLEWLLLCMSAITAAKFTFVSTQVAAMYPSWIQRKMQVISNPVTLPLAGRATMTDAGRKLLLAVGRLEPQKDHRTLVDAFSRLAAEFSDWDLAVVGEGRERRALEAQVDDLGLGGRVRFPGATAAVSPFYASAQLFAQPSRYESFGLSTVEAFMHGLPAVGFADCIGTNDLIRSGENGVLAEPGERQRSQALADALRPLMRDAALRGRLGENARNVAHRFEIEPIIDAWEAMLTNLSKP
jgi:glycosyltransferase involved in cell wall biosynthesis